METISEVRRRGPGRPPKQRKIPPRIKIWTSVNQFDVDLDHKPEGVEYQWCAITVLGKENRAQMLAWMRNGWTPVPAGRHPELTGAEADDKSPIIVGQQQLMEIPTERWEAIREYEQAEANEQMETQLERVAVKSREAQAGRVTRVQKKFVAISDEAD